MLTLTSDGTRFEFFSALRSQGCDGQTWYEELRQKWQKMTPIRRNSYIKKLGRDEFTVRELLDVLT